MNRPNPDPLQDLDYTRRIIAELVAEGILVPTGRKRSARDGVMEEVYVHRDCRKETEEGTA